LFSNWRKRSWAVTTFATVSSIASEMKTIRSFRSLE